MNLELILWIGASLLLQAVAYGKLTQKVTNVENLLQGKNGTAGVVADVSQLKTDVAVIKATQKVKAHRAGM